MTRQKIVQAPRPRAHGEDGRELHGGTDGAARRRGPPRRRGRRRCTMSDEAIRRRTGRGWEEWFDLLDAWGAAETNAHGDRALGGRRALDQGLGRARRSPSASSAPAVRRAVGEHADGSAITVLEDRAVPVDRCSRRSFDASVRERWLPDGELRERTTKKPRSARFDWGDGETRSTSASWRRARGRAPWRSSTRDSPTATRRNG